MKTAVYIRDRYTREVRYSCRIDSAPDLTDAAKLGIAVRQAVREGVGLSGADLSGADLSRSDMTGARLSRARTPHRSLERF